MDSQTNHHPTHHLLHDSSTSSPSPQDAASLIKLALRKKQEAALNPNSQILPNYQAEIRPPYEESDDSSSSMHPQPHFHQKLSSLKSQDEESEEQQSNNDEFFENNFDFMNSGMNIYSDGTGLQDKYEPEMMSEGEGLGGVRSSFISNNFNNNFEPGKNTLGKEYNEEFRRNFISNLMRLLKGVDKSHYMNIITRQAGRIKVYPNQVAVWMGIYRIAFRVEAENRKRKLTEENAIYMVEESLVHYLNNNPQEKKYRFIRVANGTFRALGIRKCTGDYWLKSFMRKFQSKFDRCINLRKLLNGCKKDILRSADEDIFSRESYSDYENEQVCNQSENKKRHIIENIDRIIENTVARIFKDKQRQLGTNESVLKSWYRAYGRFQLFRSSDRSHSKISRESSSQFHNGKSEALNRVQRMILQFIQSSSKCERSQIQLEANQILSSIRVPQLQNPRIARAWLTNLLQKRCDLNNSFYYLNKQSQALVKTKMSPT